MTGREIANNLKHSRRKWGKNKLYRGASYCVLGIKAAEAGVNNETLQEYDRHFGSYRGVLGLITLNDAAASKQDLIMELEQPRYAKKEYAVEKFIKKLLKWQETRRKQKT